MHHKRTTIGKQDLQQNNTHPNTKTRDYKRNHRRQDKNGRKIVKKNITRKMNMALQNFEACNHIPFLLLVH